MSDDDVGLSDEEVEEIISSLSRANSSQMRNVQGFLSDTQRSLAVAQGDEDALIEEGFAEGFDAKGNARQPWIIGEVLVCPGSIVAKSATSHECFFVKIEDEWVWQSPEKFADVIRHFGESPRQHQRSVTLVAALEGMALDYVRAKKRRDGHQGISGSSFVIRAGGLEHISTRATKPAEHR
jgi:hypothetical protein